MLGFIFVLLAVFGSLILALCITPWLKGRFTDRYKRSLKMAIPISILAMFFGYFLLAASTLP